MKKKEKEQKIKMPMSLSKRIALTIVGIAVVCALIYLAYYVIHYLCYNQYKEYLTSYEYEVGTEYSPLTEASSDVPGYDLVCENEYLKLYTDTSTAYVAVYDKRTGEVTYSNPVNADEDTVANNANKNYLKSQFLLYYYNSDVNSGSFNSYSDAVSKGQFSVESIENGVRYIYNIGDLTVGATGTEQIHFDIPLEYRLDGDSVVVSIPVSGINEYGNGYVYRIQLLRYMGATSYDDEGYIVVPNGSGSLIYFNNGKTGSTLYSQYIYDLDPIAANFTTLENTESAKLSFYGICKESSSLLVSVEEGATVAYITAGVSGQYNDYNYAYTSFVIRNADDLKMFGDSSSTTYVMEQDAYDINLTVRYSFLTEDYSGYSGLANYYREKLVDEGVLTAIEEDEADIPFYYDIIVGVRETSHILGVQYLHTFAMTTYDQAAEISDALADAGISNQVMNLQGWFNGGYYHTTANKIKGLWRFGGKSDLEDLNATVAENGGTMYVDVAFQKVTYADTFYNYNAQASRYYSGYAASFGLINPTTLRNTSSLGYSENLYNVMSPRYLSRYVSAFASKITNYDVDGISLRDLGNYLASDKKRTLVINREDALDIVTAQLETLEDTGKKIMTNAANDYAFAYSSDIINTPITGNDYALVDEHIPLYQMILHGYVNTATELLNYENRDNQDSLVLQLIEYGVSPHYVFTYESSSEMKETALNNYYATTFDNWKDTAVEVYEAVNEALCYVSGAAMIQHEIVSDNVRKITYDNGVTIYVNYGSEDEVVDGLTISAMSYRLEGK